MKSRVKKKSLPIGSLLASASESGIKSNELKMSITKICNGIETKNNNEMIIKLIT